MTGYKFEIPMTPSSDSDQLIKLRRQLYLWLWFIIEDTNEQPDEEVPRRVPNTGAFYPMELRYTTLLWKLSEPHHLGYFMKVSLCRHDWLNHWQLTISSISILVPFLVVERWDWKFQFFNHCLVFLVTSFHPKEI